MSEELKPCKRCNRRGKLHNHPYTDGTTDYWVQCMSDGCREETGSYDTPEAAIAEWNEPSEEQKLHAELAAKDAEIKRLRAQWERLLVEIEDLTDELPLGKDTLDDVVAAVKLICDQRDVAAEYGGLCCDEIEQLREAVEFVLFNLDAGHPEDIDTIRAHLKQVKGGE